MKHKEKLKALEKAIREALPELMEVSFGCKVKVRDKFKIFHVNKLRKEGDLVAWVNLEAVNNIYEKSINCYASEGYFNQFEIIGHEIQLHHMFNWLGYLFHDSQTEYFTFSMMGRLIHESENDKGESLLKSVIIWDLDKPLKDQSEELIDYLYSLIK